MNDNLFCFLLRYTHLNGNDEVKGKLSILDSNNPSAGTRVYLLEQFSFKNVASTFSDENGNFSFKNINLKKYSFSVISHDKNKVFNAVIADNIGDKNVDK